MKNSRLLNPKNVFSKCKYMLKKSTSLCNKIMIIIIITLEKKEGTLNVQGKSLQLS